MKDLMVMMIGVSLLAQTERFLEELGGGDSYTLDQIRECAMKSISKMTADLGEKEDQS